MHNIENVLEDYLQHSANPPAGWRGQETQISFLDPLLYGPLN